MATDLSTLSARISKASEVLKMPPKALSAVLEDQGIDEANGLKYLDAPFVKEEDLEVILKKNPALSDTGWFQVKAAAYYLKGEDPFEARTTKPAGEIPASLAGVAEILKANKPIQQMNDKELLELYIAERSYEVEWELSKRARNQPFVVLKPGKYESGREQIDVENTLELLKSARKRTNPTMFPMEGTVVPVYRITELNIDDRIIERCPICGSILYKGYCESCQLNFSGVGDDERAYMRLVTEKDTFNAKSFSDRRALWASAIKGLEDLKVTWPALIMRFEELKLTNSLPKLRELLPRPNKQVLDPFHVEK